MLGAQAVENFVEVLDVADGDLLLFGGGGFRPSRLRPVAVVVPFEKSDVVGRDQPVQEAVNIILDVVAGQVEDKLVAGFGLGTAREVHSPIRMCAVEVAIAVDHLRLHPDAEFHAEAVHGRDQVAEPVGEFLGVHGPVAEAGVVVVAGAEPAVVHDEALHADLGGFFGEGNLARFVYGEGGGFPGVVEDGPGAPG